MVPTASLKYQTIEHYENVELLTEEDFNEYKVGEKKVKVGCFSMVSNYLAEGNEITNIPDLIITDETDELVR